MPTLPFVRTTALSILIASAYQCCYAKTEKTIGEWKSGFMNMAIRSTNKKQSILGKITRLYPNKSGKVITTCNRGSCKGKKLMDLEILRKFKWNNQRYRWEGEMLAAGWNGNWYTTYIWVDDNGKLKTRTYVGFIYRTLDWDRVKS